jgi:hypothetical protein
MFVDRNHFGRVFHNQYSISHRVSSSTSGCDLGQDFNYAPQIREYLPLGMFVERAPRRRKRVQTAALREPLSEETHVESVVAANSASIPS